MTTPPQTTEIEQFRRDGYLVVDSLFTPFEADRILQIAKRDHELVAEAKLNDNFEDAGVATRLVYRQHLADNAYSALATSRRIITPLEQLYGTGISHYYTLNMLKDPGTGGWEWHQDYGYHYREFFYPNFVSAMVALEPATRDNGCLRVVRGSNRLGRLEHSQLGSQLIADRDRVGRALQEMEEVYCELNPGSVLYFDGNILHASHPNRSDKSRWSLVIAYVPASNIWVRDDTCPTTPIRPLDDDALEMALQRHERALSTEGVT
ncbi:MAG: phytanoyl-CoA dioxygenase family protein [Candidatus Latescibacterota bacterium]|nr:phytanoyl-CoA dioxygenase family protein [Candidatus Latescibacterota bacterium]